MSGGLPVTRRRQRVEQFLAIPPTGGTTQLSPHLIECALSDLELALSDRRGEVFRTSDNHWTPHALGVIVLVICALDAWLNEIARHHGVFDSPVLGVVQANPAIAGRYTALLEQLGGAVSLQTLSALIDALDVRDEIVHYLPRVLTGPGNVPTWFRHLQKKGLFLTAGTSDGRDFELSQKLCSYRLAYWVWETVAKAVNHFIGALGWDASDFNAVAARNFELFRSVRSPKQLPGFDAEHGLKLTKAWEPDAAAN